MRITLNQPYKAIGTLAAEELPDFVVLIGRNGAGKTQLLSALKGGDAEVPGIGKNDIELYDMVSFRSPNTQSGSRHSNKFANDTADAYLLASPSGEPAIETAKNIFDLFAAGAEHESGVGGREEFIRNLKDDLRRLPQSAAPTRPDTYMNAFVDSVLMPIWVAESAPQQSEEAEPSFKPNPHLLLLTAIKLSGKLPHELTRDDIMRASHYEGGTVSNVIVSIQVSGR